MKVSVSKSKNTTIYYLSKSVRIDGKVTTKTIEKIGSYDEIKKICGDMEPLEWAKQYAAKRSAEERASKKDIIIKYSSSSRIEKGSRRSVNIGYLFLKDIYYDLGINSICAEITEKYKFEYDLNDILSMLVFARVIYPGSKKNSLELSQMFLEKPDCELHQVYRALEIIAKENDFFQSQLYKNSEQVMDRRKGVLYYDCTNYYFEIEKEDDFRKYGHSKEHRPNPIIQMGLFMDADGIPLTFSVFNGNENEQPSMNPLEKKILSDFGVKRFIVCTDAGLSSTSNRILNNTADRRFVTTQSIKKLKGFLKDFCLSDDGWHLSGTQSVFKLSELDENDHYDKTFYKDRWINEDGVEQHLIVTFSFKYRDYQRKIRNRQLERAAKLAENPSVLNRNRQNDPKRFVRKRQVLFPKKWHLFFLKCGKLFSRVCGILFSRTNCCFILNRHQAASVFSYHFPFPSLDRCLMFRADKSKDSKPDGIEALRPFLLCACQGDFRGINSRNRALARCCDLFHVPLDRHILPAYIGRADTGGACKIRNSCRYRTFILRGKAAGTYI